MNEPALNDLKARLVAFWNTQQVYWDGMSDEVASGSHQRARAASFVPEGSRTLDVACGSAANAQWLKPRGEYFGSDISQLGLRRVQQNELRLVCADAEGLPFADESFDVVMSTYALEHCVRPLQMLQEMSRVVRRGGRVILLGPSWDLPFWFPNSLRSKVATPSWRLFYTLKRTLGQFGGWLLGRLPFLMVEDPDALSAPFVYDSDAIYVVWSYEVIRQMKRMGLHLVHGEVDDQLLGFNPAMRVVKRLLYRLPPYQFAGSTMLLVFER